MSESVMTEVEKKQARAYRKNYSTFTGSVTGIARKHKMAISGKSVKILDSMVRSLCMELAGKASDIVTYSRRAVLRTNDIVAACKLVFPKEMQKDILSDIYASVTRLNVAYDRAANGGSSSARKKHIKAPIIAK